MNFLLQFKCVSKDWFGLISSPEFVKTHVSFSAKDYTRHISMMKFENIRHNLKYYSVKSLFYEPVTEALHLDYPMNLFLFGFC